MLKNNVNIIQTTPTRLSLYMENKDKVEFFKQFEMIVLSGEELKKDLYWTLDYMDDKCENLTKNVVNVLVCNYNLKLEKLIMEKVGELRKIL